MSEAAIKQTRRECATAAMARLGLEITSVFVPFSQSRDKDEKQPSLNWKVTLWRNGTGDTASRRAILETDYGAGCAHAPAYNGVFADKYLKREAIKYECETGRRAKVLHRGFVGTSDTLKPDACDVLYSLVMDSNVLDADGFEDWATNLGYDTDSRKAEAIYRACLEIALKLRNAIGEAGLSQLRDAFQDY